MLAVTQYEQAARQDPSEGNIFDWGSELLLHQAFEPALAVFQAGLERYPRSLRLQMSRGVALLGLGRFDESANAFCLAYDLEPSDPLPLIFLGKSAENFSASALENVRGRMQRFVDGGLRNARVDYFYAITLLKREQDGSSTASQAEIESLLKNAIALDPAYADAYVELGVLYAAKRQYSNAVDQYQRALKIDSNNAAVHYRLGQSLGRMGDKTGAQKEFSEYERLHQQQVANDQTRESSIQKFVYTMRSSDAGAK